MNGTIKPDITYHLTVSRCGKLYLKATALLRDVSWFIRRIIAETPNNALYTSVLRKQGSHQRLLSE